MKYFGATPFNELLSPSIAPDAAIKNSGKAIDATLETLARAIPELLLFSRLAHDAGIEKPVAMLPPLERLALLAGGLQELPESVLDLLAWQLHVERYETASSLAAKQAMVFASVILHRKRGTPWAVRYGLETTLSVPAKISEWYEYGGEPYFFRVFLDVSGSAFDARSHENAISVIMAHKNVRSWLDYLRTYSTRKLPLVIGLGANQKTVTQAFTWRWRSEAGKVRMRLALGLLGKTRTQMTLLNRQFADSGVRFIAFTAINEHTRSVIHTIKKNSQGEENATA